MARLSVFIFYVFLLNQVGCQTINPLNETTKSALTTTLPSNCDYDVAVSGAGPAGTSFTLELMAHLPQSRILLIEKRPAFLRKQIVYILRASASLLQTNTGIDLFNQTMGNVPLHSKTTDDADPQIFTQLYDTVPKVIFRVETFLWNALANRAKGPVNGQIPEVEIARPASILANTLSKSPDNGCILFSLDRNNNQTETKSARYLLIAEGAAAPSIKSLNFPVTSFSNLTSERVTYYWNSEVEKPDFAAKPYTTFFLAADSLSYGFMSLPVNLERKKITEYIQWKFEKRQTGSQKTPLPDEIGFGSPSADRDVGTFTVMLQHRLNKPPEWQDSIYLAGDALSTVDPWSASGLNKAVFDGVMSARMLQKKLMSSATTHQMIDKKFQKTMSDAVNHSLRNSSHKFKKAVQSQQIRDKDWDQYISSQSPRP